MVLGHPSSSEFSTPLITSRRISAQLDVISGVESSLREGCPRTMTGVSKCGFSGHFRQVFFKHQCITPH
jgi:hypothetical protein